MIIHFFQNEIFFVNLNDTGMFKVKPFFIRVQYLFFLSYDDRYCMFIR